MLELTVQDQLQPVVVSRIRSSQKSVANSGGDAGGSSGHKGGNDRYSTPTRADMFPWLGEEVLQEQLKPVTESPISSPQNGHLYSARNAGGSRGGSDTCDTCTKANMSPVTRGCGIVTLQEQLRPVAESAIPSSQKSYPYSAENAGGSRGRSDRCDTPTKADMPPVAAEK